MRGQAADIVLPGMSRLGLAKWIEQTLDFDQLILEYYTPGNPNSGWVHCSYALPAANKKQVLTFAADARDYVSGLRA